MDEYLIFLLIQDINWGSYLIQPARVTDEGEFYNYLGVFTDKANCSPREKRILDLCQRLDTSNLYKAYGSKKFKTERDFIAKADDNLLKIIRSFTDKIVVDILKELAVSTLPLYLKKSHLDNPHKEDRIVIQPEPLHISLGFYRTEENIRYRLTLSNRQERIIPAEHNLKIITLQPGAVLLEEKLFFLPEGFSGIRLKPFQTKKEIIIPRQNEHEYFRKFILKNIYNGDIEAEGFEVLDRPSKRKAILNLEKDITGNPLIQLRFLYNNHSISPSSSLPAIVELEEDEDNYRFYKTPRDKKWEKKCTDFLLQEGFMNSQTDYYKLASSETWSAVIEWIRNHRRTLSAKGFEVRQDNLPVTYYTGNWELKYTQEATNDWFQLHANIMLEDGQIIPLQTLWENILTGNREYRFGENSVFIIPEEWFARYSAIMLFGQKEKNRVLLNRNQFSILEDEKGYSPIPQPGYVEVPEKLKATLREYQQIGYQWLYQLYQQKMGACLADDMGLGKTIQTIALLLKYKEEAPKMTEEEWFAQQQIQQLNLFSSTEAQETIPASNSEETFSTCLIVAPASVVHNWRNELRKFAPSLTVTEYIGISRANQRKALMRWDIVITTYQTLRNDIDILKKNQFGIVVFDESQSFKNRDSQVYQAVSLIQGNHFIALSGTPIENSLSDLWSLMSVINPGLLGNHATFYNYFIRPITVDINGLHSESLRKLIHPFILRRTKEEVLQDLPERTDELIICETDPEQQKLYDEELSKARNNILERKLLQEKSGQEALGSLQAIIRLRQIANHPKMADKEYTGSSGKFREIFRMLDELIYTRHKVLLFSDYVSYLNLVAEEMNQRKWEYAMLTGSTTNREEVIQQFSNRPECRFFLISLKAGGIGLNLTEADYVFILDPWWNLAAEEQAISRSHRIGQKHAVFVYRFITAGTLEEKILNIQKQKQNISDNFILSAENKFQLNEKEMEKLLLE